MVSRGWSTLVLLVATFVALCNAACYPSSLNLVNWSSKGASWMTKGAAIEIPKGTNVLLDVSPPQLGNITVYGGLYVDNKNINVSVAFINVFANGTFVVGTQACPITAKVIFEFYGPRMPSTINVMGKDPTDSQLLGNKGVAIQTDATFIVYGAWQGTAWTNLASTALNGTTTLRLRTKVYWKAGDSIVVTSTDFAYATSSPFDSSVAWQNQGGGSNEPDQTEKLTIKSIDSTGTIITLATPLKFTHWGADYQYAEVGLLTRNVVFQGDATSDASQYGAQLMLRKAKQITIIGAEFQRGGQFGILGRYPIHWHFVHDAIGMGYTLEHSSSHDNYHRCLTIHETSGVTVRDFVAYNTIGHMIFLEVGGETMNVFDHCLAAKTTPIPDTQSGYGIDKLQTIPSDHFPSAFWITNPDNTFTDCAGVGGTFAFWFSLPIRVLTDAAAAHHPAGYNPGRTPIRLFANCTGHSTGLDAVFVGDGGYDMDDGSFYNITVYKSRRFGVWAFSQINMYGIIAVDNVEFGLFFRFNKICRDGLFMTNSPNKGTSVRGKYYLPKASGISTYDNNWGSAHVNNVFIGYTSGSGAAIHCRGTSVYPNQYVMNNTFINSKYIDYGSVSVDRGGTFVITDGGSSVSGFPLGGSIISTGSNISFPSPMSGCKYNNSWPALICPLTHNHFHDMWIGDMTLPKSLDYLNVTTRDGSIVSIQNPVNFHYLARDALNPTMMAMWRTFMWVPCVGSPCQGPESDGAMINMPVRRIVSFKFILNTPTNYRPTPPAVSVNAIAMGVGEWQIVSIPYPTNAKFNVSFAYSQSVLLPRASSYAALNGSNWFYDSTTELMWVLYYAVPELISIKTQGTDFQTTLSRPNAFVIRADCNGLCNPTPSKVAVTYPPPGGASNPYPDVIKRINTYVGTLSNCPVNPGTTAKTGTGSVRVQYSPDWDIVSISIIHDLSMYAPVAVFGSQKAKGQPITWFTHSYLASSPSRYGIKNSPTFLTALYAGTLFVQLNSTLFPNGHVRANLQCSGTCTAPVLYTVAQPCAAAASTSYDVWPSKDSSPLFVLGAPMTSASSYITSNSTYYSRCAVPSLVVSVPGVYAEVKFSVLNFKSMAITSDKYRFVEFYIRISPGVSGNVLPLIFFDCFGCGRSAALSVSSYSANNVLYSDMAEFQLVSIPIVDLGFGANFNLSRITFSGGANGGLPQFAISQLRLVYTQTALTKVSLTAGSPSNAGCTASADPTTISSDSSTDPVPDSTPSVAPTPDYDSSSQVGPNADGTGPSDAPTDPTGAPSDDNSNEASTDPTSAPSPSPAPAPTPTPTPTPTPAPDNNAIGADTSGKPSNSNTAIIAGCVVGGVAAVGAAVAGTVFYRRRKIAEGHNKLYAAPY